MSTLRLNTIQDQSGSNASTPSEIFSGRAKAWVNFNGTGTVAIRASYNVSSITDQGVGRYLINFTTALPDANYTLSGAGKQDDGTDDSNPGWVIFRRVNTQVPTASACPIMTVTSGTNFSDLPLVTASFHR